MKKDMIISIKGTQKYERSHDRMELITKGTLEEQDDKYYIRYRETEDSGFSESSVLLEVDLGGSVVMKRSGDVNTLMMFKSGEKHICHYDTGFGVMNMGISTKSIHSMLDKSGGRVFINYSIDIDNAHAGSNTFEITLREANARNDKRSKIS